MLKNGHTIAVRLVPKSDLQRASYREILKLNGNEGGGIPKKFSGSILLSVKRVVCDWVFSSWGEHNVNSMINKGMTEFHSCNSINLSLKI